MEIRDNIKIFVVIDLGCGNTVNES